MPSLPDIPGKSLVTGTTNRARTLAGAAGAGALAVGGQVAKRVLGRVEGASSAADADPIAQTPTAPPGAEEKSIDAAAPKPAKPKPPKAKRAPKPKPESKPKADSKRKPAAKPKGKAKPKPASEPGNIAGDKEPHHALNNPVTDPDESGYPDPFEKRDDPRDPLDG